MRSLIVKYLEGKANTQDQTKLLEWLQNASNRLEFEQIQSEWEASHIDTEIPQDFQKGWADLQSRLLQEVDDKKNQQIHLYRLLSYAAIFLLFISIPLVWISIRKVTPEQPLSHTIISAESGQITKVLLPDSSEVWLNSGSSIKYSNLFSNENRDIELEGEAFFKVTKNKQLPMIISCSELRIKVLGTSFNVISYPENNDIHVILEEGELSLYNLSRSYEITKIKPGEMAIYSRESKQITINSVNTTNFTSWKDGILNIYNLTLEDLAILLERRFNQKFEVDEVAKHLRYTFSIKDETLLQALDLIKIINPVDPIQKNDVIYLKYNPQRALKMNLIK